MLESALGSPLLLLLILAAAALDVILPIVPAETLLITAGVYALHGNPNPWLLVLSACLGAIAGDSTVHMFGRGTSRFSRRLYRSTKGRGVLLRARRVFNRRGGAALISGRFIPGGRTASALVSGMLQYPWNRFLLFSGLGALSWAVYWTAVGMLGGIVFREEPLIAVVVGIVVAITITGLIEASRFLWTKYHEKPGLF